MAWKTSTEDRVEAVSYDRDTSADGVFRSLKEDGGVDFKADPRDLPSYYSEDWKVYKVTVVIEEV